MDNNITVLGFDFGTKRIGVAVGQTITRTATPLTVVAWHSDREGWHALNEIIQVWRPAALVVGKPLNMDGTRQPLTDLAHAFAEHLVARYQLPLYEVDERLTSKAARADVFDAGGYRALRKKPIDSLAAQIILQEWLNQSG